MYTLQTVGDRREIVLHPADSSWREIVLQPVKHLQDVLPCLTGCRRDVKQKDCSTAYI